MARVKQGLSVVLFFVLSVLLLRGVYVVTEDPLSINYRDQYPSLQPQQLTMTFGEAGKTSRSFVWYTQTSAEEACIQWSTDSRLRFAHTVVATTTSVTKPLANPISDGMVLADGTPTDLFQTVYYTTQPAVKNTVSVSDLKEGKTYYYRVGDRKTDCWSDVASFTVDQDDDVFTFVQLNDSQSMNAEDCVAYHTVLNEAFSRFSHASFLMHGGDFVEEGSDEQYWQALFDAPLIPSLTQVPAAGNHDVKSRVEAVTAGDNAILTHFALTDYPPQDTTMGVYYAFEYEHALFVVLNTNDTDQYGYLTETQYNWALQTLNDSTATWKFLLMHKSVYSTGNHATEADVIALRHQINRLCARAKVDVVFSGHDHVYNRTPILFDGAVHGTAVMTVTYNGETYNAYHQPNGTMFVIAGAAGTKFYAQQEVDIPSACKMPLNTPTYTVVTCEENTLYYTAYTIENGQSVMIDRVAVIK